MAAEKTYKNGLEAWQDYANAYADFVVEATARSFAQSLALRERLDKVVTDGIIKAQALSAQEQELALGVIETTQVQVQSAGERLGKLYKTPAFE